MALARPSRILMLRAGSDSRRTDDGAIVVPVRWKLLECDWQGLLHVTVEQVRWSQ